MREYFFSFDHISATDMKLNSLPASDKFCCTLITFVNSLDPGQDQKYVGPDLGPHCLQRISADDKAAASKERVNIQISLFYNLM